MTKLRTTAETSALIDVQQSAKEIARLRSLRSFRITFRNGSNEIFFAHHHSLTTAGDLCFITTEADGESLIHQVVNSRYWTRLDELPKDETVLVH